MVNFPLCCLFKNQDSFKWKPTLISWQGPTHTRMLQLLLPALLPPLSQEPPTRLSNPTHPPLSLQSKEREAESIRFEWFPLPTLHRWSGWQHWSWVECRQHTAQFLLSKQRKDVTEQWIKGSLAFPCPQCAIIARPVIPSSTIYILPSQTLLEDCKILIYHLSGQAVSGNTHAAPLEP